MLKSVWILWNNPVSPVLFNQFRSMVWSEIDFAVLKLFEKRIWFQHVSVPFQQYIHTFQFDFNCFFSVFQPISYWFQRISTISFYISIRFFIYCNSFQHRTSTVFNIQICISTVFNLLFQSVFDTFQHNSQPFSTFSTCISTNV